MTLTGERKPGAIITLLAWGGLGFGIAPILQTHTTTSAPQIPEIASALTVSAFTVSAFRLGIAAGAFGGGQVVSSHGVHAVTWVGAVVVAAGALLAWFSARSTAYGTADEPALRPVPTASLTD